MSKRIAILGSSEWASQLADFIKADPALDLAGFVDNTPMCRGRYALIMNERIR